MGSKHILLVVILLLFFCGFLPLSQVIGQQQTQTKPGIQTQQQSPAQRQQPQTKQAVKPPVDIQFTNQMTRSRKDMQWSQTYHASYKRTKEIPYLQLAASFCLKAINRLADTQKSISRTTKFYNMADEKRLQACQFYTKLQRMSFLLEPKHHLGGSGNACK
ncbi:MAG: hypothetical protein MJE63_19940 [Proteobacteria bacterium]|nr:hypothetical protein [Pseudomonadota bacterium]